MNEKVSTPLTQSRRLKHLQMMSACKCLEERMVYMDMCIKEKIVQEDCREFALRNLEKWTGICI